MRKYFAKLRILDNINLCLVGTSLYVCSDDDRNKKRKKERKEKRRKEKRRKEGTFQAAQYWIARQIEGSFSRYVHCILHIVACDDTLSVIVQSKSYIYMLILFSHFHYIELLHIDGCRHRHFIGQKSYIANYKWKVLCYHNIGNRKKWSASVWSIGLISQTGF